LNHRPLGYEPNELPDCSTPHFDHSNRAECRQTLRTTIVAQLDISGMRSCRVLRHRDSCARLIYNVYENRRTLSAASHLCHPLEERGHQSDIVWIVPNTLSKFTNLS
jgi:hypothetical protein